MLITINSANNKCWHVEDPPRSPVHVIGNRHSYYISPLFIQCTDERRDVVPMLLPCCLSKQLRSASSSLVLQTPFTSVLL